MTTEESIRQSSNHKLKGNVMLGKKASLKQYENVTVSLMREFFLDESDAVKEAQEMMNAIDSIITLAKKRWLAR